MEKNEIVYEIKYVEAKSELEPVLELCYGVLGRSTAEHPLYSLTAWCACIKDYSRLLIYAQAEGRVISLVLGRPESGESLVCGCVACDKQYRKRGITRKLMEQFEANARDMGFRYITLGAAEDTVGFYERCGYNVIAEVHGQKVLQKML